MSGLVYVLGGGALLLGLLIFIHESGHYMVAKALGIRIEVFSLGFGPRLVGIRRGHTDYRISVIPLGGYVKMLGENPDESLQGSREEFLSRSKFDRFLVLVTGAGLNIVLAVALMAGVYLYGLPEAAYVSQPPMIGGLDPNGGAAAAGLQVGDVILKVDGREVPTWRDLEIQVALNPDKLLDVTLRRQEEVLILPVKVGTRERNRTGIIGVLPHTRVLVTGVSPGSAAERAGLRAGDVLDEMDGQKLIGALGYEAFARLASERPARPFALKVLRDGQPMELALLAEGGDGKGDAGLSLSFPMTMHRHGLAGAVRESLRWNAKQAGIIFLSVRKLISRELSPRTLSGPIEIFRMTGEALKGGWLYYLMWMAAVSVNLGVVNLLPIPILDGGHIFILFIEGLMRRDLSLQIKERVMQFGFILLLLIMGGVIYLDVSKMFSPQ